MKLLKKLTNLFKMATTSKNNSLLCSNTILQVKKTQAIRKLYKNMDFLIQLRIFLSTPLFACDSMLLMAYMIRAHKSHDSLVSSIQPNILRDDGKLVAFFSSLINQMCFHLLNSPIFAVNMIKLCLFSSFIA